MTFKNIMYSRPLQDERNLLVQEGMVKTVVSLGGMSNFAAMKEVYAESIATPFSAHSIVAVNTLPKKALVEVECIAAK